jgi:uncharacterized protein YqgC (DUF456 family)
VNVLVLIAGILVVVLGVVSLVLPAVPGVAIVYLGVLMIAWAEDFTRIGVPMLVFLGGLAAVAMIADNVAGLFGARRAGASGWGVFGAGIGALVGIPFGLPGIILGPAIGALGFEYLKNADLRRAGKAGLGGLFGFLLGIVAKCVFAFMIIGLAVFAYFF